MVLHLKKTFARISSVCCLALVSCVSAVAETKPIVFGIVPQQSATRLAQIWTPFLERLGEKSGLTLQFSTAKDIPTFEACLEKGRFDVAYMNPYHYTVFHDVSGYEAFAKAADKTLKGVLVAPRDGAIEGLDDLDGKELAFPSPAAFGASVLPRAEMQLKDIEFTSNYVKSHDSVYRSVALGLYAAGGGVQRTLNGIPDDLRSQLKVIHTTQAYTPHAFAFSADVHASDRDAITQAMLSFEDKKLLQAIGMKGFEQAEDADWDDVRALGLEQAVGAASTVEGALCHLD